MLQLRPEATVEVRGILERVLAIDPAQAQAFARLSIVAFADYANQWNDATPENMTKAMELARKAIELDDSEPQGHIALSLALRSEEHTSELQSLMRISYAVFCLKKKTT